MQEIQHPGGRDGQDFRAEEAGRLAGAADGVEHSPLDPLILALGGVLGRLEEGIVPQPLPGAIKVQVELQTLGQRLRALGQLAAESGVAGDPPLPAGNARSQASSSGKSPERSQVSAGLTLLRGGSCLTCFMLRYQRISTVPQANPAPKPLNRMWLPGRMRSWR